MYAAQPDLSACSQMQLLQQLLLADRYGVPKVLVAVAAAFASISPAELQWEAVHAVYALPAGSADMDSCKDVYAAVGEKLQAELGDLELVWADNSGTKPDMLVGLPHQALLQLLGDARTCVASEDTVFYTIWQWCIQQEKRQPELWRPVQQEALPWDRVQEVKQLLHHLRIMVRGGNTACACKGFALHAAAVVDDVSAA
jgi:hypothetical protein